MPCAGQQDLGRQDPFLKDAPLLQQGGRRAAAGRDNGRQNGHGGFYRRLPARIGKAKAVTATARKIAVLFYNTLRYGMDYVDPGAAYCEERYRQRVLSNLTRRADSMGYVLQPKAG